MRDFLLGYSAALIGAIMAIALLLPQPLDTLTATMITEPDTLTVAMEDSQDMVAVAPQLASFNVVAMDYGAQPVAFTPMYKTVCIKNPAKQQNQNFERHYTF